MPADGTEISRERLIAYLLAELPAGELAALDERLLREEAFAEAVEAARTDLLDEYAHGEQPRERHERIRQALHLPERSDSSVAFARALHTALAGVQRRERGRRERRDWRTARWALPLAACLLLGLGTWWYRQGPPAGRAVPSVAAAPFTLLLTPQHLRAAEGVRAVRLPPGLRALRVQIVLGSGARSAEVRVSTPAGSMRFDGLAVRHFNATPFVQIALPASALRTGLYHFEVRTVAPEVTRTQYSVMLVRP
jgi:hypothetical protein